MYSSNPKGSTGSRKLRQIEDNLKALRAEAKGGYGKDEVRRNCIKADLIAQREAKERAVALKKRQEAATNKKEEEANCSTTPSRSSTRAAGVGTAPAADPLADYPRGEGGLSFLDTLFPEDGGERSAPGANEEGAEAVAAVAAVVLRLQSSLYPQLQAVAADYRCDTAAAARLGAVREWDTESGLPQVWAAAVGGGELGEPRGRSADLLESLLSTTAATTDAATQQQQQRSGSSAGMLAPLQNEDGLVTPPRPPAQQGLGAGKPPDGMLAASSRSASMPGAGTVTHLRIPGHRAVPRDSIASTRPVSPCTSTLFTAATAAAGKSNGPPLATKGTAVAVNYAEFIAKSIRKQVAREQQQQVQQRRQEQLRLLASAEAAAEARNRPAPVTIVRAYKQRQQHADGGGTAEVLCRVTCPLTLLFCPACHGSFTCDIALLTSAQGPQVVPCTHCAASVEIPTAAEGLLPPRRQDLFDEVGEEEVDGFLRAMERAAPTVPSHSADGVGMGTDAVGFPTDEKGSSVSDDNSFAAAVAAVRRAMAAGRATDDGAQHQRQQQQSLQEKQHASAAVGPDTPPSTGTGCMAWERALFGTYFLHLWDEVHSAASECHT